MAEPPQHVGSVHGVTEGARVGRYTLGHLLGRGGFGEVWAAVMDGPGGLRKDVALKLMTSASGLLKREARIGGLLRHPHLVDVYEVGEADGVWFCAMERCDDTLERLAPLPPRAVVDVGLRVCAALQYAHADLGLVHLDLKPANLLVRDGVVKVADLGLAHADGFVQEPGRVRGTPGYMAPEQLRGEAPDPRTDIYALALTLIRLGGGATSAVSTLDVGLDQEVALDPVAGGHSAGLDARLEALLELCLAPDRAHRPASMADLARALRELDLPGKGLDAFLGLHIDGSGPHRTTNVSSPDDTLVGRAGRLEALAAALDAGGAVTVYGAPGVGKSRLAHEAALGWGRDSGGEVWRCEVGAATSVPDVLGAVGRLWAVDLDGVDDVARLGRVLHARSPALLWLDDADGVDLEPLALAWSHAAPEARVVVTRRAVAGTAVAGIEVPPLHPSESQALFAARARERGVDVAHDPRVADVCAALDGLPLAVELAAGRLGVLTLDDVVSDLSLSLLRRATSDRHGTLRTALELSWHQLARGPRRALAELSVFAGRFSIEAAEAVVQVDGLLDALDVLIRASLVSMGSDGALRLLASVRQFAAEMLEQPAGVEARHGRWFSRAARQRVRTVSQQRAHLDELDDQVAACRRAVARGDGPVAVGALLTAWHVLSVRGPRALLADLAEAVCGMEGLSRSHRAEADFARALALGDTPRQAEVDAALAAALDGFRAVGDAAGEARALSAWGRALRMRGEEAVGVAHIRASLDIARRMGDRHIEAVQLAVLAGVARQDGDLDTAEAMCLEALRLHRQAGSHFSEGVVASNLGSLALARGRHEEARARFEEALSIHVRFADRGREASGHINLGNVALATGELEQAYAHFEQAAHAARRGGHGRMEAIAEANLAEVAIATGDGERGLALVRRARTLASAIGDQRLLAHLTELENRVG